jgi:hypothetical protein
MQIREKIRMMDVEEHQDLSTKPTKNLKLRDRQRVISVAKDAKKEKKEEKPKRRCISTATKKKGIRA